MHILEIETFKYWPSTKEIIWQSLLLQPQHLNLFLCLS